MNRFLRIRLIVPMDMDEAIKCLVKCVLC
jgi:hypothetical protein